MFWIVLIIAALFLAGATTKKQTADCGSYRRGERKDRLKDLRRDTRRRQWALALADILARRNGLPIKGVELVFKLDDDKRRYLAQQVKRAGLERKPRRRGVTPQGRGYLTPLACGHRQLAAHVLSSSGGPGPGPRRAGLRLYAHRLPDPLYRRARLVRRKSGLAGVIT